jgi:hypothetical protein
MTRGGSLAAAEFMRAMQAPAMNRDLDAFIPEVGIATLELLEGPDLLRPTDGQQRVQCGRRQRRLGG